MSTVFIFLVALFALIGSGVWIGLSLLGTGWIVLAWFRDVPMLKLLGQISWNSATTSELVSLPLFILMAEILFRTRISEQLFKGLEPAARHLPGGLLHVNVLACTLFAAVSGSSAATAATVGKVTYPELVERGYDPRAAIGSLAGAGTLGFLIPPSIVMIVYGVMAEVSIIKLFMAGIIPGLALALAFMTFIAIRSLISKPHKQVAKKTTRRGDTRDIYLGLLPVVMLILLLIGSMYAGIATPNEAAAIGVLGASAIAALQRCLTVSNISEALLGAVRTTSMIGLILVSAAFLATAVGFLGIAREITTWVAAMGLGPLSLVLVFLIVYLILGCFLDGISMIVMTLPIALPMFTAAGYDAVWFGVFLVVVVELAQVTPPVGINLFVIQQISNTSLASVARAAFPYFLIMCGFAILLAWWPQMVMFLPQLMGK